MKKKIENVFTRRGLLNVFILMLTLVLVLTRAIFTSPKSIVIYTYKLIECVVPEKSPYPPHGWLLEIPRGRGVLKAKFLERMLENKHYLNFLGGEGGAKQKSSMGGV